MSSYADLKETIMDALKYSDGKAWRIKGLVQALLTLLAVFTLGLPVYGNSYFPPWGDPTPEPPIDDPGDPVGPFPCLPFPAAASSGGGAAAATGPSPPRAPRRGACPYTPTNAPPTCDEGPATSNAPVMYRDGSLVENVVDFSITGPGGFSWDVSRSYRTMSGSYTGSTAIGNRWYAGVNDMAFEYYAGKYNFVMNALGRIKFTSQGSWVYHSSPDVNMVAVRESYQDGSTQRYHWVVTDYDTNKVYLFHYDNSTGPRGRLKEETTIAWREANRRGTRHTYSSSGKLITTTLPQGLDYFVEYGYGGPHGYLTSIDISENANPSSKKIGKIWYRHWKNTDSAWVGSWGDLVQVKVWRLDSEQVYSSERITQYRYYAPTNGGQKGYLKDVFEHDAVVRMQLALEAAANASSAASSGGSSASSGSAIGTENFFKYGDCDPWPPQNPTPDPPEEPPHGDPPGDPDPGPPIDPGGNPGGPTDPPLPEPECGDPSAAQVTLQSFASRHITYHLFDIGDGGTAGNYGTPWVPRSGYDGGEDLEGKYGGPDGENWDEVNEGGPVRSERIGSGGCSGCGSSDQGIIRYYHYIWVDKGGDYHTYYLNYGRKANINEVAMIVVEDTTDTAGNPLYRTIFGLNDEFRKLREVKIENPLDANLNCWCQAWIYDDVSESDPKRNKLIEYRGPSAYNVTNATQLEQFLHPYNDGVGSSGDPVGWVNDNAVLRSNAKIQVYRYNADGMREGTLVKQGIGSGIGESGHLLSHTVYGTGNEVAKSLPVKTYVYRDQTEWNNRATGIETNYTYTYWDSGNTVINQRITTLPPIDTDQNGPGSSTVVETRQVFDEKGRLRWTKDGEGVVTYRAHNPKTGGIAYEVVDLDVSAGLPAEIVNGQSGKWDNWSGGVPSGFSTSANSYQNLLTKTEYDLVGRPALVIDANDKLHYGALQVFPTTDYRRELAIRFPYWDGGQSTLPIEVNQYNEAGQLSATYTLAPDAPVVMLGGKPVGLSGLPAAADCQSLTVYGYDSVSGKRTYVDRYHDIPAALPGALFTNYNRTYLVSDHHGNQVGTVQTVAGTDLSDATVQFNYREFDVMDRLILTKRWVGKNFDSCPEQINAIALGTAAASKPIAATTTYDEEVPGSGTAGIGDGYVTSETTYHTESGGTSDAYTLTKYHRTFRGHLRGIEREHFDGSQDSDITPYQAMDVNWQGRTIAAAQYTTQPTWPTDYTNYVHDPAANSGQGEPTGSNFYNTTITKYDDLGRVYRTLRFPGTEPVKHFEVNNYYDRNGRLVCTGDKYSAHTEYAYDGAGRQYQQRTVKNPPTATAYTSGKFDYSAPAPHPSYSSMSGGNDGVIELSHTVYDQASNATGSHTVEINHDDSNGFSLASGVVTGGIRSTTHHWYDDADRLSTMANYGSGDGSSSTDAWQVNTLPGYGAEPAQSTDHALVTKYEYHDDSGRQDSITIWQSTSVSVVTKTFHDDLGRRLFVVENYVGTFDPVTNAASYSYVSGENRTTGWEYNGLGQTIKLTAYNNTSSTGHQETKYFYEDPHSAALVTHTIYPDSSETAPDDTATSDQVKRTYNLDGSLATMTDQRGVAHTYQYNERRQLTFDAATATGGLANLTPAVDDSVQGIGRVYDNLGRLEEIISYDGPSDTATELNKIDYNYRSYGPLYYSRQHHGSIFDTVYYSYTGYLSSGVDIDSSGAYKTGLKLAVTTYPDGAKVYQTYGNAGNPWNFFDNVDGRLGRISHLRFDPAGAVGSRTIATYMHNGTNRLAEVDYANPLSGVSGAEVRSRMFSSSGNYDRWDRFGRTKTKLWEDHTGTPVPVDQVDYSYDYVGNRMSRNVRVDLIPGATLDERDHTYTYDLLHRLENSEIGNLSGAVIQGVPKTTYNWTLDQLGNWDEKEGLFDYGSTQGYELQDRTHNEANELVSIVGSPIPASDDAGNLISAPKTSLTGNFDLKFDAWNRLVEVKDGTNVVQTNEYDGFNRRIVRVSYTGGSPTETRHFYYNQQWQVLEERVGSSTTADRQYVYHPHYVDAIAMRYDAVSGDEHFYLQDANFNVTAVVDESGAVEERYAYTPYGRVSTLAADFTSPSSSTIDNEYLYTGRRLDPKTGLQLNRWRYYASHLGRWINRDPAKYWGGLNLYGYVGGMPTYYVDPNGQAPADTTPISKPAPPGTNPSPYPANTNPKPPPGRPSKPPTKLPPVTPKPGIGGRLLRCCGKVLGAPLTFLEVAFGCNTAHAPTGSPPPWIPDNPPPPPPPEEPDPCKPFKDACNLTKMSDLPGDRFGSNRCEWCYMECKKRYGTWPGRFLDYQGKWKRCDFLHPQFESGGVWPPK